MISVIMLTYNREALISRAIESILAQTYRDFEFIIVDNGSSDRSGQIADGYALKDSRIRVVHRERGNIGLGRNTGLDAAQGEYITFIDDDDWAEPDFMDIEGSEKEALLGAAGIIKQTKPQLAICAYHKAEDIYELPQTILKIRGDYRLLLRQYVYGYEDTILYAV